MGETVIDLREAALHFAELTPLIRAGQVITLCDADQPVAEIRPLPRRTAGRRAFGLARGTLTVPDDFGKPDPDLDRMFGGEPACSSLLRRLDERGAGEAGGIAARSSWRGGRWLV